MPSITPPRGCHPGPTAREVMEARWGAGGGVGASGESRGRTKATLLPFSKIWSSFVTRLPSAVISLRRTARRVFTRACSAREREVCGRLARPAGQPPRWWRRAGALFGHVLEHHVHVVVEAAQSPNNLLVAAHDRPDPRSDALVDQLCERGEQRAARRLVRPVSPSGAGRTRRGGGGRTEWQDLRHQAAGARSRARRECQSASRSGTRSREMHAGPAPPFRSFPPPRFVDSQVHPPKNGIKLCRMQQISGSR